ncbi:MAG: SH3 domain-containing protein [Bacteroidota bacterium]
MFIIRDLLPRMLVCCLILQLFTAACTNSPPSEPDTVYAEIPPEAADGIPLEKSAICVWPYVGLRAEPGRKRDTKKGETNYLETIVFGEKVELLDSVVEVASEKRFYMLVRLRDEQIGWVHDYLFEKNSRLAVLTGEAEIYRRPDMMTLRDEIFVPGEIIAVIEDSVTAKFQDWLFVSGKEKDKKGWIPRKSGLTFQQADVNLALRLEKAIQEFNPATNQRFGPQDRLEKLQVIQADSVFQTSPLWSLVEEEINALVNSGKISLPQKEQQQLFIVDNAASLYAEPNSQADVLTVDLTAGSLVSLIQTGPSASFQGHTDVWYQVNWQGQEGWVFGYYTSLRKLD